MKDPDYLSPIAAIVAVIVGFMLSQLSEYIKRNKKSKMENEAIKKLIGLELSKNTVALHGFLNGILKDDGCEKDGEFSPYEFSKRVEKAPFPTLSVIVWKTQLERLPHIYREVELSSLWNYYQAVEEIWQLYEHICEAHNQASASAASSSHSLSLMAYGMSFKARAKDAAGLLYQNILYVKDFEIDA